MASWRTNHSSTNLPHILGARPPTRSDELSSVNIFAIKNPALTLDFFFVLVSPLCYNSVMMNVRVLGTGSGGNCVVLDNTVALDFGVPQLDTYFNVGLDWKQLNQAKTQLKVIFISHSHQDHTKSLNKKILKQFLGLQSIYVPEIYYTDQTLNLAAQDKKVLSCLPPDLINKDNPTVKVLARFDVKHDVPNDGYVFQYKDKMLVYATDIGDYTKVIVGYNYDLATSQYVFYSVADLLKNPGQNYQPFDLYVLECNQDQTVLRRNLAQAKTAGERKYFSRAAYVHLNTADCQKLLAYTKNAPVLLVHRSQINLPINAETYWFLNANNENVKVAINPFENFDEATIKQFHLTKQFAC